MTHLDDVKAGILELKQAFDDNKTDTIGIIATELGTIAQMLAVIADILNAQQKASRNLQNPPSS